MFKKLRNYLFMEDAEASNSDKFAIVLLAIVLAVAVYSMAVGYGVI